VSLVERFGETKIQHLGRAVGGDHHVGGLQVTMDDAAIVGGLEGLGDLPRDGDRLVDRDRAAGQTRRQRLARDVFHDEISRTFVVGQLVNAGDVRVLECAERLRLALEAGHALGVGRELWRQGLDRHVPPELRVARPIHLAHAPGAEVGEDFVRSEACAGGERHELPRL
jgi:hypothetical protein